MSVLYFDSLGSHFPNSELNLYHNVMIN